MTVSQILVCGWSCSMALHIADRRPCSGRPVSHRGNQGNCASLERRLQKWRRPAFCRFLLPCSQWRLPLPKTQRSFLPKGLFIAIGKCVCRALLKSFPHIPHIFRQVFFLHRQQFHVHEATSLILSVETVPGQEFQRHGIASVSAFSL